jgi:hypothetical protein
MVKSDAGAENIFNLTRPLAYRCQILHYHRRLSRLYIEVMQGPRDAPAFYLLFADVAYIDAPAAWQGADFAIASREEAVELMLATGLIGPAVRQFPDAYAALTEVTRLYQTRGPGWPVRILAGSANMLRQVPAEIAGGAFRIFG